MANNIIKYLGNNIGKSVQEENSDLVIKEIFLLSETEHCKLTYPEDIVVGKDLNGKPQIKELNEISSDEMILDIGPKTINMINNIIDESNTILWNGPLGVFENDSFSKGTEELSKIIASSDSFSLAGGGETLTAINKFINKDDVSYCSTGGGAFLEFMEGKELPSIAALKAKIL